MPHQSGMFQHFNVMCCQSWVFQEPWLSPLFLEADVEVVTPGQGSSNSWFSFQIVVRLWIHFIPPQFLGWGPLPCKGVVVKWKYLKCCHVEEGFSLFCKVSEDKTGTKKMVIATERWIWTLHEDGLYKKKIRLINTPSYYRTNTSTELFNLILSTTQEVGVINVYRLRNWDSERISHLPKGTPRLNEPELRPQITSRLQLDPWYRISSQN